MTGNENDQKMTEQASFSAEPDLSAPSAEVTDSAEAGSFPVDEIYGGESAAALSDEGLTEEYKPRPAGWGETPPDDEVPEIDPAESIGQVQAVPVRMFDFEYNIMSDKPRLVEILAAAIDREAREIRAANGSFNRGTFNWPVQVAFKLALDHYNAQRALGECRQELDKCRRELETLTARVERDAEKLAGLIEAGLDSSE
ncbi:hypothetical protein C4J81_05480 [Deltaproteobacteria bacterium Smac51]|nr:hypothetical protein C4J81_05480 [Deltaproteobacteria bacterium Smac51]